MRRLILSVSVLLAACATTGSSGGNMTIETVSRGQAVPGAACMVSSNGGSWNVMTPASINVGASTGDLRVVCNMQGYRTSELLLRPSGPVGSGLGLGVGGGGGHVGVGVGLNVPITLGRGGYPTRVAVELTPQ
ncbi:hypothetical protein SAMN06265795_10436 [Noviherbaspirillum humi]|uniref:Lipoprotein n=1 Tax=Noviherbaspirillum humi TaxID=1688639 RepID=A0A239FS89_9BURK|nr:hypothetical protein [Noviherbaspirillum humi]SNS58714.1 hypothetical protein SAMN06265795_10436 [Noviherbaspirillum humi]